MLATVNMPEQVPAVARTSWSGLGTLVLVLQDFWDIEDEEWLTTFNVNVMSNVRLSRHFLKPMLERGQVPRPVLCHPRLAMQVHFKSLKKGIFFLVWGPHMQQPLGCSRLHLQRACEHPWEPCSFYRMGPWQSSHAGLQCHLQGVACLHQHRHAGCDAA